jgi:hypothetical protein
MSALLANNWHLLCLSLCSLLDKEFAYKQAWVQIAELVLGAICHSL